MEPNTHANLVSLYKHLLKAYELAQTEPVFGQSVMHRLQTMVSVVGKRLTTKDAQ